MPECARWGAPICFASWRSRKLSGLNRCATWRHVAANRAKLFHMEMKVSPTRSTLSDALNQRDWCINHAVAQRLIARARALYAQEPSGLALDVTVYALDSTTIVLCLSLFDWASFPSTKAAIKRHTLLDLRGAIRAFIHISDGKLHDVNVLYILPVEAGAFYVMDRGYVDFARLYPMHQTGAFFVTRAKKGMNARRVYSAPTERSTGMIRDQTIHFNGFYGNRDYPEHLRRIRFKDPESGKTLTFLTSNMSLPALTIAAFCKSRWQVELFSSSTCASALSGHQRERGEDANLCAIATYLLIALVKQALYLDVSLYTCLQILSVSVFERTQLSCPLQSDRTQPELLSIANHLNLVEV